MHLSTLVIAASILLTFPAPAQSGIKDGPSPYDQRLPKPSPPATAPVSPSTTTRSPSDAATVSALATPEASKEPPSTSLAMPGKADLGKPPSEQLAAMGQRTEETVDWNMIALFTLAGLLLLSGAGLSFWAWRAHQRSHFVRR